MQGKNREEGASDSVTDEKDFMITVKIETGRGFQQNLIKSDTVVISNKEQPEYVVEEQQYKNESEFEDNIPMETVHSESDVDLVFSANDTQHFRCEYCTETFFQEKVLFDHLKTHAEPKYEIWNKEFNSNDQINENIEQPLNCSECTEKLESKPRLKFHRSTNHLKKKQCKQEARDDKHPEESAFQTESNLVYNSLCEPNGRKTIHCKLCDSQFNKISILRNHLDEHKSLKNFNFENCDFIKIHCLKEETDLNDAVIQIVSDLEQGKMSRFYSIVNQSGIELRLSDSETDSDNDDFEYRRHNYYICDVCSKNFDRKYKALYHQNSSHNYEELPHQCFHCTLRFISTKLLKDHLKSQCNNFEKQLSCQECNMKFMWHENLVFHSNIQHSSSAKKVKKKDQPREKCFTCKFCDKSFYRQEHLDRHAIIHQPDEKKFECPTCHKKFNRKDNMKSHMKIHRDDREKEDTDKHLCVYCGRSFSNSSNLIVHMRRHTGEKPYKCHLCDKGFPRSSDLQCHRRTHTGEKPCLCTICGKGFSRSNKLARHMRIHTGVRPYKCTYCDRAFTQSNDLTLHIRRHTGDKPYVCGICGERFIQGTALHTHRRLKGHYEEAAQEVPYSSISVNNPNRLNFANRVDRIGVPKESNGRAAIEIKPVGRNSRATLVKSNCEVDAIEETCLTTSESNGTSSSIKEPNRVSPSNQAVKNISNYMQSSVPVTTNSAFVTTAAVPFVQLEERDFFTITNLGYQTYQ